MFALFLHYNMAWGQPQITVLMMGIYQTFKSDGAGQKKLAFIHFRSTDSACQVVCSPVMPQTSPWLIQLCMEMNIPQKDMSEYDFLGVFYFIAGLLKVRR